jgi:uridine phosphorylase
MPIAPSELILNTDGSIYHLNLKPDQLAHTIITVGDPERVPAVTAYFDTIEFKARKREFHTQTGIYKGKRMTVISTGIGTDNIDIVFNELDALVNVNFETREIKPELTSLDIIRIGTSGSIQEHIAVDSFLLSIRGIGLDSLAHWYDGVVEDSAFAKALSQQAPLPAAFSRPYVTSCDHSLAAPFMAEGFLQGNTVTNVGFYGPQSRSIRLAPSQTALQAQLKAFNFNGEQVTNLEMETAGIYALASLLGHRAISLNAILANRATGTFSENPSQTIEILIKKTLDILAGF